MAARVSILQRIERSSFIPLVPRYNMCAKHQTNWNFGNYNFHKNLFEKRDQVFKLIKGSKACNTTTCQYFAVITQCGYS